MAGFGSRKSNSPQYEHVDRKFFDQYICEFIIKYETVGILEMFAFKLFTILILVLSYGRIVEVFLMVSVSPIAFATLGNKEWGVIGTNYIKGLLALAFQGFFIMVLVGIYAALVKGLSTTTNLAAMAGNLLVICVLFCFGLFKTASLSKQIFTVR